MSKILINKYSKGEAIGKAIGKAIHEINPEFLSRILKFINADVIPRLLKQGHIVKAYTPKVRVPKNDILDKRMKGSQAWFEPFTGDVTFNIPTEGLKNFALGVHEVIHGLRTSLINPNSPKQYTPVSRKAALDYFINNFDADKIPKDSMKEIRKFHYKGGYFNPKETSILKDAYYRWVKRWLKKNKPNLSEVNLERAVLDEMGAINSLFRALHSKLGNIVGDELTDVVNNASDGKILKLLIDQEYTGSIADDIAELTGESVENIKQFSPKELTNLAQLFPILKDVVSNAKTAMTTVGGFAAPILLYNAYEKQNNDSLQGFSYK